MRYQSIEDLWLACVLCFEQAWYVHLHDQDAEALVEDSSHTHFHSAGSVPNDHKYLCMLFVIAYMYAINKLHACRT